MMKKRFYLAIFLIAFFADSVVNKLKAQWVTIPDSIFVEYLTENFPTCMDGNLMDTTCNLIVEALYCWPQGTVIQSLEGIQYFDNLLDFNLSSNYALTNLPKLPATVQSINLDGCTELEYIEEFPPSLTNLRIHFCINLQSIPEINSPLQNLTITANSNLVNILELPSTVTNLHINDNSNLELLPILPDSVENLDISNNHLTSLINLPNYTKYLNCRFNWLSTLPELPQSLEKLRCEFNYITELPALPDSLRILDCPYNLLTVLPDLPDSLKTLYCSYNILVSLPDLPNSLLQLDCGGNQISCFPIFPNSITQIWGIDIYDNLALCLPNYIDAMNPYYTDIPLCIEGDSINNMNGCTYFQGVRGKIYSENNENCVLDSADNLLKNVSISLFDTENNLLSTIYSFTNGYYNFIDNEGTYTVKVDTLGKPYEAACLTIDSTYTINEQNPFISQIDFALQAKDDGDLGILSINTTGWVFPGQTHQVSVSGGSISKWYNLQSQNILGGTLQISVNGPVNYFGVPEGALIPDEIAGNVFTYNISNFEMIDLNQFVISFTTDTTAQSDDQVCVTAIITNNEAESNLTNNSITFCYLVVNSYDPNDKHVYPTSVLPGFEDYFIYNINFQNTGTAPAINIKVLDTLDMNLDFSTFEIINYSHPNTTTLIGNIINFKFNNIYLPDSTTNIEDSKGFIQYKIKPLANLPEGTQIKNTAHIYFDYNTPIQTNTVESTFENIISVKGYDKDKINVYPNPSAGLFHINIPNKTTSEKRIEVFNMLGEKSWSTKSNSNNVTINLSEYPSGIYILKIFDAENNYLKRIVKQ
jgi:uncharacterized repeat protein (TIGR01451 family)